MLSQGFESADNRQVLTVVMAGLDRSSINKDGRNIQPRHGDHCARHILVAGADCQQSVNAGGLANGLDRVGNHFARDEAVLHSLGAHGNAVADCDGAKALRHGAGCAQSLDGAISQTIESHVARRDRAVAVGDADDRFVKVAILKTGGAQHGPIRRALQTLSDHATAIVAAHSAR